MNKNRLFINRKFGILVCVFTLVFTEGGILYNKSFNKKEIIHNRQEFNMSEFRKIFKIGEQGKQIQVQTEVKEESKAELFTVTAYDLSYQSCGKLKSHPEYGISRGGTDLRGQTWKTIKAIAVDLNVIPLGTKVRINFLEEKYKKYNNIYTAVDIGSDSEIVGNRIDIFIEDSGDSKRSQEAIEFGVTHAKVEIIKED